MTFDNALHSTKKQCTAIFRSIRSAPEGAALDERLSFAVENSGNMAFQEAVIREIIADKIITNWDELNNGVDALVLTMANFIRPDVGDLERFVSHIERCHIERIVLIGVGAQAYHYDDNLPIATAALRLLRIVSERSKTIGVRGYYTAELLNENGIKNIDVIGCPSVFMRMDPAFKLVKSTSIVDESRFTINATPAGFFRDKIADLYRYARTYDAEYVLQNERYILAAFRSEAAMTEKERHDLDFFVNYYSYSESEAIELRKWLSSQAKIFFSVEDWMAYSARRSFFMGGRIHGNILAVLSGVPALTLTFDTRTRELCEYLNLPCISFEDFDRKTSLQTYFELANFENFNTAFPSNYIRFIEFLRGNNLAHRMPAAHSIANGVDFGTLTASVISAMPLSDRVKMRSVSEYISSMMGREVCEAEAMGLLARLRGERSEMRRLSAEATSPGKFEQDRPSL